MAKKLSGERSTGGRQTTDGRRPIEIDRDRQRTTSPKERSRKSRRRPTPRATFPSNQGIPEEHYYGESSSRAIGKPVDAGALDHELLSKDFPHQRTYVRDDSEER